jgi:hypothetical protein
VGRRTIWQSALGGLTVEKIDIVEEWKDKARVEQTRSNLLRVLRKRFPPELPADLEQVIQQTADLEQLSGWLDSAVEAQSLEAFRAAVRPSSEGNG